MSSMICQEQVSFNRNKTECCKHIGMEWAFKEKSESDENLTFLGRTLN